MSSQDAVDDVVAKLLRPLVDQDLSVAFYDMTTIRAEGLATMEGDPLKRWRIYDFFLISSLWPLSVLLPLSSLNMTLKNNRW